jgi:hypothetical protein
MPGGSPYRGWAAQLALEDRAISFGGDEYSSIGSGSPHLAWG